jgi:hypothetical protein
MKTEMGSVSLNSKKLIQWALLAGLTALNANHAFAGNGIGRGGVDMMATLEGLLPKSIVQRTTLDFDYPLSTNTEKPLVKKGRCGLLIKTDCYFTPQNIVADIGLSFDKKSDSNYSLSYLKAYFALNGQNHDWAGVQALLGQEHSLNAFNMPVYGSRTLAPHGIMLFGHQSVGVWDYLGQDQPGVAQGEVHLESIDTMNVGGAKSSVQIWIDGKTEGELGEKISERFERIPHVLAAQADFSSPNDLRALYSVLRQVDQVRIGICGLITILNSITPAYVSLPNFFLGKMNSDRAELTILAHSAVAADGTCNADIYGQLLARLGKWSIGSPAYFYELNGDTGKYIDESTQIKAMGIRQQLRMELNRTVVPYCERQGAGTHSQVDLLLND